MQKTNDILDILDLWGHHIINNLENDDTNLERSIAKYNRMMQLNNHIQELFKKKLIEIRKQNFQDNKKNKLR